MDGWGSLSNDMVHIIWFRCRTIRYRFVCSPVFYATTVTNSIQPRIICYWHSGSGQHFYHLVLEQLDDFPQTTRDGDIFSHTKGRLLVHMASNTTGRVSLSGYAALIMRIASRMSSTFFTFDRLVMRQSSLEL